MKSPVMPLNQAANLLLTLGMDLAGRDKLTDFSPLGSVTAMSYWRDVGVRFSVFGTTHDRTPLSEGLQSFLRAYDRRKS
jgi:hypothetical protein